MDQAATVEDSGEVVAGPYGDFIKRRAGLSAPSCCCSSRGELAAPRTSVDDADEVLRDPAATQISQARPEDVHVARCEMRLQKSGEAHAEEPPSVIWVSLDPSSSNVAVYPKDVAMRIEEGFQQRRREVQLLGLGGFYDGAVVELERTRSGRPEQKTRRGRRDVRRLEVPRRAKEVVVRVIKESRWKIADDGDESHATEERRTQLLGHEHIPAKEVPGTRSMRDDGAALETRAEVVAAGGAAGHVGLWEWCRAVLVPDSLDELGQLSGELWGLYLESQNEEIETAFRDGKHSVKIVIGIRTYEIVFDTAEYGRQLDHAMRKRRHVRRRLMPPADRDMRFREASRAAAGGTTGHECAICCSTFEETPTLPTIQLPACSHIFHSACIQHVADKKGRCPLCRTEVDWRHLEFR